MALRANDPRTDDTRQRLLDAATQVFAEVGYDGARVQEIARRAGLTTGAIYGKFRDKAELLVEAIGARGAEQLDELLPTGEVPQPAGELLADMGTDLMRGGASDRQALLIEALVAARRDPALAALVRSSIDERATSLGRVIDHARAGGGLADAVDTPTLVSFGLALALGASLFKAIGLPRPDDARWAALITRLVGALVEDTDAVSTTEGA